MEIQSKIIDILGHNGITISQENGAYIINKEGLSSIAFVSSLVEIEGEFNISIPDYLLTYTLFDDFSRLVEIVRDLINNGKKEI